MIGGYDTGWEITTILAVCSVITGLELLGHYEILRKIGAEGRTLTAFIIKYLCYFLLFTHQPTHHKR